MDSKIAIMEVFEKALKLILSKASQPGYETVLLEESINRILARDILADSDMPPFNRSAMDGYAIRKEDLHKPLKIIDEIAAGTVANKKINKKECAKIMTGAPIPEGADFVVMIEDTSLNENSEVIISGLKESSNIRYRGEDLRKGDVILKRGALVKKQHIGLMASVGEVNPQVYLKPKINILSTGSELVEPDMVPLGAEIRNSNGVQILSQLKSIGLEGNFLGIARDDPDYIREMIDQSLHSCNVLLITGGVSMGDYDFVPEVLTELGFEITLHKIKVRPGKPLLFAKRKGQFVFGIPGNPVSAFVQMEVVIKPFLYKLMGSDNVTTVYKMVLGEDFKRKKSQLKLFVPVKIIEGEVFLVEYHGSGHLASYAEADGIMEVNEEIESIKKQETVNVRPL